MIAKATFDHVVKLIAVVAVAVAVAVAAAPADATPLKPLLRRETAQQYPSGIGTVALTDGKLTFHAGKIDTSGVAYGNFTDQTLHPSAFGHLTIVTNPSYNDTTQAKAAGILEGSLTAVRMKEHYDNIYGWLMGSFPGKTSIPQVYIDFINKQDAWIQHQIATNTSDWWTQLSFIMAQFDGLVEGYNAAAESAKQLSRTDLLILQGTGDFLDLIPALTPSFAPDWYNMSPDQLMANIRNHSHCSGLIKVTGNYSDLFMAHSSWFTYASMLRVFKNYNFQFHHQATAARKVSFSSYPGLLSSLDDFYQMDSGLGMVQTTNGIYNKTLYTLVKPEAAFAWQRVRLACQMANTGEEWSQIISHYNSGTYNNQYMVVNFNLFHPGAELPSGVLYVSEQIPGLVAYGDVTQQLERGYWPSYNIPYWPEVYERSGYPALMAHYGESPSHLNALAGLSYQLAPRAKIFRRDQGKVVDMQSFKDIMRYNEYKTDPYAHGDAYAAICSRGDLADPPSAGGCYDTKVTWDKWMPSMRSSIINGPTTNEGSLPPFQWTSAFDGVPHEGQPEEYNFSFEDVVPKYTF